MKTLAQQYKSSIGNRTLNPMEMASIAREHFADIKSNCDYTWIEFCDDSVLSFKYGEAKAYKRLMPFHRNGVVPIRQR